MLSKTKQGYRILICIRGNCADPDLGRDLETHLNDLIIHHGLDQPEHPQHTTCRLTNCLGVCHSGPIIIVHPGAIRYHHVDKAVLNRVFEEHICQGNPVQSLILPYPHPKRKK